MLQISEIVHKYIVIIFTKQYTKSVKKNTSFTKVNGHYNNCLLHKREMDEMTRWLRENTAAAALLTIIRIYLGWTWLNGGIGKLTGGFDCAGFLTGAIKKAGGEHPIVQGWWASFLENFALPYAKIFNILVPVGELLVGIALLLGLLTTFAALMGIVMNFAFLFSGTISTNPNMILLTVFILVAGANAGKFGLDHYALPYVRAFFRRFNKNGKPARKMTLKQS